MYGWYTQDQHSPNNSLTISIQIYILL